MASNNNGQNSGRDQQHDISCEDKLDSLLSITEQLVNVVDLDTLLNRILLEARLATKAEAGSIYLVRGDRLKFSYVHNEKLFQDQSSRYKYQDIEMPIDERSLAGFVAKTGQQLCFEDVYDIPEDRPYTFNRDFDNSAGYRSKAMMVIPIRASREKVVGVLQIINPVKDGRVGPFTQRDQNSIAFFANNAGIAVDRAMMTRELILRMVRMAELRDPHETGAHVSRVSAYCAEIYAQWARAHEVEHHLAQKNKDLIRVAGMLHDVGKVAISDTILKKPGRLTPEEYELMKYHTVQGATLFKNPASELDIISAEIARYHHERWDGGGYPGKIVTQNGKFVRFGPGLKGEEIPLFARMAALADVYDALISSRVYKKAWQEDKVLAFIKEQSGKHFDPQVVEAFLKRYEVMRSIKDFYPE
jgi:HD-GYP domain-containing protein (c-di-GMP phosphodiesterase class II)